MHLHVLASGLDEQEFLTLTDRFEIRTTKEDGLSVGGVGVVSYDNALEEPPSPEELASAWRWLGVTDHD